MSHLITADAKFKVAAVANLATAGGWTPVEIDATGFDRACFVVQRGSQTGAAKNTSNKAYQLEFSVNATKPFLKLYGTGGGTGTSTMACAAVAILYRGSRALPPTQDVTVKLA